VRRSRGKRGNMVGEEEQREEKEQMKMTFKERGVGKNK
jgi:hypothetical protein